MLWNLLPVTVLFYQYYCTNALPSAPSTLNLRTTYILLLAVTNRSVICSWNFNSSSTITPRYLTLEDWGMATPLSVSVGTYGSPSGWWRPFYEFWWHLVWIIFRAGRYSGYFIKVLLIVRECVWYIAEEDSVVHKLDDGGLTRPWPKNICIDGEQHRG